MRLAEFILANIEPILAEWESFARDNWPGASTDPTTLRDHAEDILRGTARDMASAQTTDAQAAKSKGQGSASSPSDAVDHASIVHAATRVRSGFDVLLLVAEYRALRASVLRLWRADLPQPDHNDIDDVTRFNESIDQSLTKAVAAYTREVERSREMFLAILGHDLRNPLGTITLIANVLALQGKVDEPTLAMVHQISASGSAMSRIINDLLDFAGARLGGAMPISTHAVDLAGLCREVVRETRGGHPERPIVCHAPDPESGLPGEWDPTRLRQLLSNLLGNAIQHGAPGSPITLTLTPVAAEDGDAALLTVHNDGAPIPRDRMTTIFNPLVRDVRPDAEQRHREGSIGLGLYIAREVVHAHGGTIDVASSVADGTTFTVRLPIRTRAAAAVNAS